MTKLHEEVLRTTLSAAIAHFSQAEPRGEFVLVIEGAAPALQQAPSGGDVEQALRRALDEGLTGRDASTRVGAVQAAQKPGLCLLYRPH